MSTMSVEGDASTEPLSVVQFGDAASSDVVIAVEHMRFIAHRQHLSSACAAFRDMFAPVHKITSMRLEITIDQCDPFAFRELLTWLYTGQCANPLSNLRVAELWSVLELAMHYNVESLVHAAEDAVLALVSVKTCCSYGPQSAQEVVCAQFNNERLAAACSAFFHTRLDDVLHSGYFDSRILDLLPPATVHMLASMPADPQPAAYAAKAAAAAAAAHPMRFTDTFNVPPPPPMPVAPPPMAVPPPPMLSSVDGGEESNLASMVMPARRPSSPTSSCDDMLAMPDLSPTTSVEAASEFFELFDTTVSSSAFSLDQLPLFPGLPNTPFNALPTAFASLGDALAPPPPAMQRPPHSSSATSSTSSTASNDNTLRTGQSIAARMPLLQGPVWWQTIDQLRVMLESLRVLVRADMCTLFLADDITDELYARIITNDNRVWEIAMPATLGLVGAAFTTRQTVNVPSAYNDPRFYRGIDDQLGIRTQALAATPIMTKLNQRPIGVIEVLNSMSQHAFSEANVREIEFVARMAASLVEIAMARVKSTVESHIDAIHSGIGKLQSEEVAGATQLAGKKRAQQQMREDDVNAADDGGAGLSQRSSSGRYNKPSMVTSNSKSARKAAQSSFSSTMPDLTRRVSMPARFDPLARRSSEPWTPPKPVPSENPRWLGPTDIFLKTGPLPFTELTLFPDGRRKRPRPSVPILHLRPLHTNQATQAIIQ